jgi:hypothetical protein
MMRLLLDGRQDTIIVKSPLEGAGTAAVKTQALDVDATRTGESLALVEVVHDQLAPSVSERPFPE